MTRFHFHVIKEMLTTLQSSGGNGSGKRDFVWVAPQVVKVNVKLSLCFN
jgi:hypothetical protein